MKDDKKNYIILTLFTFIMILIISRGNLFASNVDWLSQHAIFIDYFRSLFYESKSFFPDFALAIGSGQNIYNFSYYGLFNPLMYISYIFPKLDMIIFLQIIMIIVVIISVLLFYNFLKRNNISSKVSFITSCFFSLATPLIFHAKRHIMFISYMPFLLLGLIAMNKYFKDKKQSLLIISIFLMILTSYYYSIGGILVLIVYYFYLYMKKENITLKAFLIDGIKMIYPFLLGILLASFLLLPTFYVILNSVRQEGVVLSLSSFLIPHLDLNTFLYDGYGMGLGVISLISIGYLIISCEKDKKTLAVITLLISVCPLIIYFLNGGLYLRSKVLIPFLPLICLIIAHFLTLLLDNKVNKKIKYVFIGVFIFGLLCLIKTGFDYSFLGFIIEFFLLICFYFLSLKLNNYNYFILVSLICAFLVNIYVNFTDELVSYKKYNNIYSKESINLIDEVKDSDKSIYRMAQLRYTLPLINKVYGSNYYHTSIYSSTQNNDYKEFYHNYLASSVSNRNELMVTAHSNVLLNSFLGVKYLFTTDKVTPPIGYDLFLEKDNIKVYKNKLVFPLIYHDKNILDETKFLKIKYPDNVSALMENTIVTNSDNDNFSSPILKRDDILNADNLPFEIEENKGGYKFSVNNSEKFTLKIDGMENKILLLDFDILNDVSCDYNDRAITIGGITNKITCSDWLYKNDNYNFQYALSSNDTFEVIIDPGTYVISNINTYFYDYENIKERTSELIPFEFDKDKTKGDVLKGKIDVDSDGYLVTSIPYDEGFNIFVNGRKIEYEKVNTAFLGFKLEKGSYNITFDYSAPWSNLGKIISFGSFLLFMFTFVYEIYKGRKGKNYGRV